MAYAINKTDGTVVATVADGTLDTASSSLSLIGKNYAGYGEVLNENQIKLLENFANTSSNTPTSPLQGQIWYNTTANQLQVYNGSSFKSVSGANVSSTEPTNTGATHHTTKNTAHPSPHRLCHQTSVNAHAVYSMVVSWYGGLAPSALQEHWNC